MKQDTAEVGHVTIEVFEKNGIQDAYKSFSQVNSWTAGHLSHLVMPSHLSLRRHILLALFGNLETSWCHCENLSCWVSPAHYKVCNGSLQSERL